MRVVASSTILVAALIAAANGSALQIDPPEPGVYAQTEVGLVPMKKPIGGVEIAGSMRSSIGTRAFVFPVGDVTEVPVAQQISGFIVNLATVQDAAAASAQLRFVVGEHVREPDFQVMRVLNGQTMYPIQVDTTALAEKR